HRSGLAPDELARVGGTPDARRHVRRRRHALHARRCRMSAVSLMAAAKDPTLADFGKDPWWLILIKVVVVFVFLVVMTLFAIWYERRVVARMQVRPGPNRNGPFGLLQSLADGLKLAFKEDIMPKLADKAVYFLAPVISTVCAFTAFAIMPFGPMVS